MCVMNYIRETLDLFPSGRTDWDRRPQERWARTCGQQQEVEVACEVGTPGRMVACHFSLVVDTCRLFYFTVLYKCIYPENMRLLVS